MPIEGRQIQSSAIQFSAGQGELDQLRLELQRLRAEYAPLLDRQRQIMELLGSTKTEQIVHDLRNVLNERNLLRTLTQGKF